MNTRVKEKTIGAWSLGVSLLAHLMFVVFLHSQTLWFSGTKRTLTTKKTEWTRSPRHEILDVTLVQPQIPISGAVKISPHAEAIPVSSLEQTDVPLPTKPQSVALSMPSFPVEELLAIKEPLIVRPMRFQFQMPSIVLDLPKSLVSTHKPLPQTRTRMPHAETHALKLATSSVTTIQPPKLPETIAEPVVGSAMPLEEGRVEKMLSVQAPVLPELPTLDELETVNLSDAFEMDLSFVEKDEGGYLFAITLLPRKDLELPKIRQHVTFLIDRSNSIQRDRLMGLKNAVRKALHELQPDDTFNIIAFDSKVDKLFTKMAAPTPAAIAQAEKFLDDIQLGSLFSSADLYKPLLHTIPAAPGEDEIYTAVLLTDGASLGKRGAKSKLLQQWTQQNQGRLSLYTVAMTSDNQLSTLETVSALNKGKLLHATTNRGLKRKLLKLMKMIHTPVAKNIAIRAIVPGSGISKIVLSPSSEAAAPLYLNQPYVLLGSAETLDDFILFFQGRMKDKWLNLRKDVSFLNAKRGGMALHTEWALQSAYRCYNDYARDNQPSHLAEAKAILEPLGLSMAIE